VKRGAIAFTGCVGKCTLDQSRERFDGTATLRHLDVDDASPGALPHKHLIQRRSNRECGRPVPGLFFS